MRSQIEGVTKDWPTFPQSKALPTKRYNKVRQIHFTTRRTLFLLITKATHYSANKNHYSTSPFLHLPRLLNQTNNARSNNIPGNTQLKNAEVHFTLLAVRRNTLSLNAGRRTSTGTSPSDIQ